jgi:hypothetical protein
MAIHGVTLKVTPCLRIECKFLVGEDGWQGSCEQPHISVHAETFEQAKSYMECELGKHIEELLRQNPQTRVGHAA